MIAPLDFIRPALSENGMDLPDDAMTSVRVGDLRLLMLIATLSDYHRRQNHLSACLAAQGGFNRRDLTNVYGVSIATAVNDIRDWLKSNPAKATYNMFTKRYEATP